MLVLFIIICPSRQALTSLAGFPFNFYVFLTVLKILFESQLCEVCLKLKNYNLLPPSSFYFHGVKMGDLDIFELAGVP